MARKITEQAVKAFTVTLARVEGARPDWLVGLIRDECHRIALGSRPMHPVERVAHAYIGTDWIGGLVVLLINEFGSGFSAAVYEGHEGPFILDVVNYGKGSFDTEASEVRV